MQINEFVWLEEIVDKLNWKHHVSPEEVEEAFLSEPYITFKEKGRRNPDKNAYVALGQTEAGRYLFVLFILKTGERALTITAREMTRSERKLYEKKKKDKLPKFKSLEEMGEFWDTHDFTDFASEFTEVKDVKINIRNRTYLPVSVAMYEKMERIADRQGKTVEALIREWLSEKLTAF